MAKYPIFLELSGRRVVVIGAGAVAARKAQALLDAGARLVVVADKIDEFEGPLTLNVSFTDYLTGKVFKEQKVIKPR